MLLDDNEWNRLVLKQAVNTAASGPLKTGIAELDAIEREMHEKYGGS